ncbi:SAM-dependent methyltransferase [Micromonospora sp. WMMD1082]|uniref:class I SAM-dependent methyltransferase n=1 Tax=Micromonospora sp. WMMD1082 TaxID=3016104 RepID=UPI0024171EEA|nr:SAM-dependent methyltransferase [Micromonospora sp. WMMD1082]MDG4798315.1 SAM-dependent methyltransferase [Micromonospora sp. WMMD1082]
MSFFLEFVRDPLTVGAIAPSSPALARVATAAVPRTGSPIVVEVGPGTGAFTAAIQMRLAGRGRHIAVEVNPRFAQRLAVLHPAVDVVNADASDLVTVLAQRGLSQVDVVVSGLPWAAFAENRQRDVLSSVVATLPPHGVFTTFAYVHTRWARPARRLLRSVRSLFDEVIISRTEWANLPPALVYYCRRPWANPSSEVEMADAVTSRLSRPGQQFLGTAANR